MNVTYRVTGEKEQERTVIGHRLIHYRCRMGAIEDVRFVRIVQIKSGGVRHGKDIVTQREVG